MLHPKQYLKASALGRPKDSAAWRRAKRAGYQINKTEDGTWRWSKNFGEYSDGHTLRADAIEEALEHYENNSDE